MNVDQRLVNAHRHCLDAARIPVRLMTGDVKDDQSFGTKYCKTVLLDLQTSLNDLNDILDGH
jgi:hypothetical protein